MRQKEVKRELECVLTDSELKEYSKILAVAVREKTKLEADLKTYQTQKKAEIESRNGIIALMSEKVSSGKEYREVKCSVVYDWDRKEKFYIRQDTGEEIRSDIITERELQEEAELNAPNKGE